MLGIVILVVVWAGFNGANIIQYRRFYIFARRDLGDNLALLSTSIAGSIPSDWVEALTLGMPDIAENDPSDYIYSMADGMRIHTIAVLDTSGKILFSSDENLNTGEFNPYWASDLGSISAAAFGVASYGGLRRVGERYLRVAFAPIIDPFDDVVGVVAVEAGADYFGLLSALRKGIWFAGLVSTVAIVFIALVLWFGKREIERLHERLERAATLSGIGMMAATLAHEVRNPLAIIRTSAESIPNADKKEIPELTKFINEEVDRLVGIVESHLAVARGREFPKTTQKLSRVIEKVIPRYEEQLRERGIGIIMETQSDPIVPYSFSSIRQVVYNILENAASATSPGNVIKVVIASDRIDGVEFGIIEVSDNGKGIPDEQLEHIFEPFHTTKKEGTGLGLFITKQIIDGHGGKILVESELGKGTKFIIALPKG